MAAAQAGPAPQPSFRVFLSGLTSHLAGVQRWLQAGPIAGELRAMGYEPETTVGAVVCSSRG